METTRPLLVTKRKKRIEMTDMEKLIEIREWSEDQDWFDDSFLRSLEDTSQQNWFKEFTSNQSRAIDNMYEKFVENQ